MSREDVFAASETGQAAAEPGHCRPVHYAMKTTKERRDFQQFMKQRNLAASAYVRGEFSPLEQIVARSGPGSFFGPQGGVVKGAAKVFARYKRDAKSFEPVGRSKLKVLDAGTSGDLAYWVGIQRATARLKGMKQPVPMNLRVTELFQRDGQTWKMIHRHADSLIAEGGKQ